MTPIARQAMGDSFTAGFRTTMERFGAPLETIRMEFVNGIAYVRPVPVIDKPGSKPPPKVILRLACLVHPELRRRQKAATDMLANSGWRDRMVEWRSVEKPHYTRRNRELQAIDLTALDNVDLVAHLDETIEHLNQGLTTHFEIAPVEAAPFGLLCADAGAWGLEPEELLGVLVGASPATVQPSIELEPLRAELQRHDCTPASLDEVRACSPEAARLLDEWMHDRRWLVSTGYDLDDRTLGEMPEVILAAIKAPAPSTPSPDLSALRERVPAGERAEFDYLVSDAREAFQLRDENGPLTGEWPVGLVRRALLEVGRRAVERGLLDDANLATVATRAEVGGLLGGDDTIAATIAERQARRLAFDLDSVPSVLGDPEPAPDPDALPGALGRFTKAVTAILGLELANERRLAAVTATAADNVLHGTGIGNETITGRARVARWPDDLMDGLDEGDVVVTPATAPTWNIVLSAATGLVVEEGGLTGHAAIVAREFGLPTVIGVKGAATRIPDGAAIELDAAAGVVTIL